MIEHKLIYALTCQQLPGERIDWINPRSNIRFSYTVSDDGETMFYVGETSVSLAERLSKHRTQIKKLQKHLAGQRVNDPHLYPVYYFALAFCGANGLDFRINLLQEGPGLAEREWIAEAKQLQHPIQNKAIGGRHTDTHHIEIDTSINGLFKTLNDKIYPKAVRAEPTSEEIMAARAAWITKRKADLNK